ncbi:hypothetical protein ACFSKW_54775 [Nonomuraea mangrovi]|uniref:Helix-turn-helix domain-containing protein n=1 Tax=Nonomuraea mangrovi TaxID=2316207 RepID=A0ABW4THK5_9ACTN
MSARGALINCACCGQPGRSDGRNLIESCYRRHLRHGTLDQYPRLTQAREPWKPLGPHGRRMVERYCRLASIKPALSVARIAFELGVSERQVWRYATAANALERAS